MDSKQHDRVVLVARITSVVLVGVLALRIAWMSDDALITLRTALNITHSWGPGYNATERVQAYTHPLWLLLWTGIGATTNQWMLGILALSIAATMAAVGLIVWRTRSLPRIIVVTGVLAFSNAFMDYATGGLENPLGYLLVGLLVVLTLRALAAPGRWTPAQAIATGLVAAAAFLTRFDYALLIAPALLLVAWKVRRQWQSLALAALSFAVPLVAWFAWTKATYDSWLPNTFEAKRNVHIPASELVVQGIRYLWVTFEHDPVAFVALLVGVLGGLVMGKAAHRAWAIGVLLYVGYVVWIGGDFKAGRFVAVPVYVAAFLIALVPSPVRLGEAGAVVTVIALGGGAALAGSVPVVLSASQEQRWEIDQNFNANVIDARGSSTANGMSLRQLMNNLSLAYINPDIAPLGDGSGLARTMREVDKAAKNWPTNDGAFTLPSEVGVYCGFLGDLGIATGPTVHLIDNCALTDRYLASKPFSTKERFAWNPGHFHREVPEGYVDAVKANDPKKLADAREAYLLQQLWSRIRG